MNDKILRFFAAIPVTFLGLVIGFGLLCYPGCASLTVTTAQGITIAQPVATAIDYAILRNNPSYIPVAQKVGADLASANYSDLTLTGINTLIQVTVTKEGGSSDLVILVESGIDSGVAAYLGAVAESSLSSDPNAQAVLQALGASITQGATLALANPKSP